MQNLLFTFQPMKKIGCILLMSIITLSVCAQKESDNVRAGNKLYKASKFTEAEIAYRKGLVLNAKSFEANYNLGNALFKQKKYTEALNQYNAALELKPTEKTKIAAAYHNVGNSLLADNKVQESIDAYKIALKNNPTDDATRYNLAYAQLLLKKQQQEQQKQDKQKKPEDQEADRIKKKADELVAQRKYNEAYDLMKSAEKTNKSMLKYADFTNRILDIIKMN